MESINRWLSRYCSKDHRLLLWHSASQLQKEEENSFDETVGLLTMIGLVNNDEIVRKIKRQNALFLMFLLGFHKLTEYLNIYRFLVL